MACDETDPEFLRVAGVFSNANFNFHALLHEMFSSPLVTLAAPTQTFTSQPEPITIRRQEHFCAALSNRLGLTDICGLTTTGALSAAQAYVQMVSTSIPAAGYSRGSPAPVVATDPNLFFRAAVENVCAKIADQLVDNNGSGTMSRYQSNNPQPAFDDMTQNVMALPPSDVRYPQAISILAGHFANASAMSGTKPTDALKSTFVLACTSPSSVSSGL